MEATEQQVDIFKVAEKDCQPRTLYLVKLSIKNEELKIFPDKNRAFH